MSTPVSQNIAAQNPKQTLTGAERECLLAIATYRFQRTRRTGICVGNRFFKWATVEQLQKKELLAGNAPQLKPTTAGSIALTRLGQSAP